MNKNLFLFKDGIAADIHPKPFLFELAMEGYLVDNPVILSNSNIGLEEAEVIGAEESIGTQGRIDILLRYSNDSIAVVELKNVQVTDIALQQLLRYLQAKKTDYVTKAEGDESTPLIGIIVGPELDKQLIADIESRNTGDFVIYGVELQRYYDKDNWYITTQWYFPKSILTKKDYTKYILGDKIDKLLGKGRLVYEVIKDFLVNNPSVSFKELQEVFPDTLRNTKSAKGKHHVVSLETDVSSEDRFSRYFKDSLNCADGAVVVSSQWGIGNISSFISRARQLGYSIKVIK